MKIINKSMKKFMVETKKGSGLKVGQFKQSLKQGELSISFNHEKKCMKINNLYSLGGSTGSFLFVCLS